MLKFNDIKKLIRSRSLNYTLIVSEGDIQISYRNISGKDIPSSIVLERLMQVHYMRS